MVSGESGQGRLSGEGTVVKCLREEKAFSRRCEGGECAQEVTLLGQGSLGDHKEPCGSG